MKNPGLACDQSRIQLVAVKINRSTLAFLSTLTLAACVVFWVIRRVDDQAASNTGQIGWQHADAPPANEPPIDPWLSLPDAWTEAAIPVAREIGPALQNAREVVSVADGIVIFSGIREKKHAVIIGHRNADGIRFESIYTPLAEVAVRRGDLVGRGTKIGKLTQQPMATIMRAVPKGMTNVGPGKSKLAITLESPDPDAWMSLGIGNAEKMLELMESGGD